MMTMMMVMMMMMMIIIIIIIVFYHLTLTFNEQEKTFIAFVKNVYGFCDHFSQ
jgi:hypothetical protein